MVRNFFICTFVLGLWKYLCTVIGKLLCFINKRKLSTQRVDKDVLTSIKIQGENSSNETTLVDWSNWEDGENKTGDETPVLNAVGDELFKDMEPVINKAKVIHVKKTVRAPVKESPLSVVQNAQVGNIQNNSFDLNPSYQVESELGVLQDETSGWDDEIDENFISKETETIIQTNKVIERERRLMEQRQKKMERDLQRAQKRQDTYIGVKIK